MTEQEQPAPDELASSGRALWTAIAGPYELEQHELSILLSACRIVDKLDRLEEELSTADSLVVEARTGPVAHPALVESRQQSLTLSRLVAALRVPLGEEDERRPQRRGGARKPYVIRPVS